MTRANTDGVSMAGWTRTAFTRLLGLRYPIVQGPFGGGLSTTELVGAVSSAGGLGSFGANLLQPGELDATITELEQSVDGSFAVNLWIPTKDQPTRIDEGVRRAGLDLLRDWYAELGVADPELSGDPLLPDYDQQVGVLLERRPPVFSFVFGIPSAAVLRECRLRAIVTVGAATNLDEGLALEAAGVDVVVASGIEAGGHRPSFLGRASDSLSTGPLTAQLSYKLGVPVVAAGGIADGRGIASAIALGAAGVQLGTAFLATDESGVPEGHRDALLNERARFTTLTRAISGRLARSVRTEFVDSLAGKDREIPDYPQQLWLTAPLRAHGAAAGNAEVLSLWAGQGASLLRERTSASVLMERLVEDTGRVLTDLAALSASSASVS